MSCSHRVCIHFCQEIWITLINSGHEICPTFGNSFSILFVEDVWWAKGIVLITLCFVWHIQAGTSIYIYMRNTQTKKKKESINEVASREHFYFRKAYMKYNGTYRHIFSFDWIFCGCHWSMVHLTHKFDLQVYLSLPAQKFHLASICLIWYYLDCS